MHTSYRILIPTYLSIGLPPSTLSTRPGPEILNIYIYVICHLSTGTVGWFHVCAWALHWTGDSFSLPRLVLLIDCNVM